jgi:D-amino-acid dehydrogenase
MNGPSPTSIFGDAASALIQVRFADRRARGGGMYEGDAPGMRPRTVAVIGAGIVGVSTALFLQRDGHAVTLIDREGPASGTSFGNAGGVVASSCAPLGMPGILKRVPGMLLNPHGPLSLRWAYLPRIAPWLLSRLRASRPDRVEAIADALAALNRRVVEAWRDLAGQAGIGDLLHPVGWLTVYETDRAFAEGAAGRDLMARRGLPFEILGADELRQLEPGLAPIFKHGSHMQECLFVANPGRAVKALAADFVDRGGRLLIEQVTGFAPGGPPHRLRTGSGREIEAEVVVLAAGAWSRGLARQLGARVALDTERGYHLMLPPAEPGLSRPTVHGEQHFVLCPMEHGTRMTCQVELGGLDAPPDFRRARALLATAQRMLPGLRTEEESAWMGYRPSLPDSLPVIGPAPGSSSAYLAFGHGHLGMTQGPVTGRIVADLVAGRDPGIDLSPYRPGR